MGKIFPCSVKKPPAPDIAFQKHRPPAYISYYIYCIIKIFGLVLFIYMYWRNTCIERIGTWNTTPYQIKTA
jgi:hypothetical protein